MIPRIHRSCCRCWCTSRPTPARRGSLPKGAPFATSKRSSYATESTSLPKRLLMAQPPPAAPTSQAQHPESATTAVLGSSPSNQSPENEIDSLLYSFHRHIRQSSSAASDRGCASVSQLYDQLDTQSRIVLDEELPYEDAPLEERRIRVEAPITEGRSWVQSCRLAQQRIGGQQLSIKEQPEDGLVLVSHIVEASPAPVMSWSLGFLVKTSEGNTYAISCSHTLESVTLACLTIVLDQA